MGLRLITAPTDEVIDAATAASEASLTASADLDRLSRYLVAARSHVEMMTGRALLDQTWELVLPGFPAHPIEIPRPPLLSLTSVSYLDTAGVTRTLAVTTGYVLETMAPKTEAPPPARLHQPSGVSWPSTAVSPVAVIVRFRAGYGTASTDVPELLRLAVARRAAQLFDGVTDDTEIQALVAPYKVWTF